MKFKIMHETDTYLRVRLASGRISESQEQILRYALSHISCVDSVKIFPATGGVALTYSGDGRQAILDRMGALHYENIKMFAKELDGRIAASEIHERKLDPALKRKIRQRMFLEMCADLILPTPVQAAYHVYQIITLKEY